MRPNVYRVHGMMQSYFTRKMTGYLDYKTIPWLFRRFPGVSPEATAAGFPGGVPTVVPVNVTFTPAADAGNVSPTDRVVVSATGGTIRSVTVAAGGASVAGALETDQHTWRSTGQLAYRQTYTITATVADATGATADKTSTFSTIKPASTTSVAFQANALAMLKEGGSYGVGQVVVVRFGRPVADKAAAQKAVVVDASPNVDGRYFWLDKQTLHFRPEKYWAAGSKITVKANLLGVHLGNGAYDGSTIDFWTHTGVHVVLERDQTVHMTSASYGIKDPKDPNYYAEDVSLCLRISYGGEYCHAAGWNVPDHGVRNVSHGCVNMNPEHAQWLYNTFTIGDVVEVTNTPVQLPVGDGIGDWNVRWSQYGS